jgi:nucleoside-diphosphate-sugar epimerase
MRLVITGSLGDLGRVACEYALSQGADVLGVDQHPYLQAPVSDRLSYLSADLTHVGEAYDVLDGADAIVHLAAIRGQRIHPSARTFITNMALTWNVLEAAARLGVHRVVLASSIQVNSTLTPRSAFRYQYLPLDEDHPTDPQDEYGLAKVFGEQCGDMFARHYGLTTLSLRFPWIASPDAVRRLPRSDEEPKAVAALYTYIDARDAARACYLAATADLPPRSHTVLFVAARDSYLTIPSRDYIERFFPQTEIRPDLEHYGSLVSSKRAKQTLGFVAEYGCHYR